MAGSRWSATGAGTVLLGILVLALVLLSGPTGLGATSPTVAAIARAMPATADSPPPAPNLTIDPAVTWAYAGNATPLEAFWTSGGAECTVLPVWFHWFVGPGPVGGLFGEENSSIVNFTGATARSGTALVGVRSAAVVRCGNESNGLLSTAYGSVVEVAEVGIDDLTIGPMPLVGGDQANLTGRIEGGTPPYQVTVQWGDASEQTRTLTTSGLFGWSHLFRPGNYSVQVEVADSSGEVASAVLPQTLQVNASTAAAVTASTPVAEVGRPVLFTGVFTGLPPLARSRLSGCEETSVSGWGVPPELECDPASAGPIAVSLEADAGAPWPVLTQTLNEPVAPALSVHVCPTTGEGEVDTPAFFDLRIAGGAPPFSLAWTFGEGTESGREVLAEDGTLLLEIQPNTTGFAPLALTVSDADGADVSVTNASLFVVPGLSIGGTANSSVLPPSAEVELVASVTGGVGPIAWVVLSSASFTSGDPPTGWLPGATGLRWSGLFPVEGTAMVELVAVDAAGALANFSALAGLVPRLTGQLSVSALNASEGPGVLVTVNLSGGAPPLTVWINASGGASWNATDPSDGLFEATVPVVRAGPSSVSVAVVDRLGGRLSGVTFVIIPVPPDPPTPPAGSSDWTLGAGVLGLLFLGVTAALYLRFRRRPSPPPAAPDPEKVLEKILAPADGAERVTVELLAEEAGIPLETVRSTLTRLVATGKVRSEVSPDGEEVLAWSDPRPA